MRLTVTLTYAAAPARIAAMMADEEFLRQVCAATVDPAARVEVRHGSTQTQVRTARTLPTDRLPDAMRKIVGGHVTVVQTAKWPAQPAGHGWTGQVIVEVEGKPVRLDASATVTGDDASTQVVYDGDLHARVPFLGGAVERAVEPVVRSALEAEQRVGAQWLADNPA